MAFIYKKLSYFIPVIHHACKVLTLKVALCRIACLHPISFVFIKKLQCHGQRSAPGWANCSFTITCRRGSETDRKIKTYLEKKEENTVQYIQLLQNKFLELRAWSCYGWGAVIEMDPCLNCLLGHHSNRWWLVEWGICYLNASGTCHVHGENWISTNEPMGHGSCEKGIYGRWVLVGRSYITEWSLWWWMVDWHITKTLRLGMADWSLQCPHHWLVAHPW